MRRNAIIFSGILLFALLTTIPGQAEAKSFTAADVRVALNAARARAKLPPLRRNVRLETAARIRAEAIRQATAVNHGTASTKASVIIRQVGYRARATGELLAANYLSAKDTVSAWSYSVKHRPILFSRKFQDFGVAVIQSPSGRPFDTIVVVIVASKSGL